MSAQRPAPASGAAFCLLCLCWGSTFVPLKEGLSGLPPLLFAGLRFTAAAGVFTVVRAVYPRTSPKLSGRHLARLIGSSFLTVTLSYGLLFWGAQFLPSGVSGLVSFGSVALSLTAFSLVSRLERTTLPKLLGLGFGAFGLGLLAATGLDIDAGQLAGVAAIFLGGVSYAAGSLLGRPALERYGALQVTACQMAAGGGVLLLLGLLTEPASLFSLLALRRAGAFSLLYLVLIGSSLGFWLYNRLLATWEPSRLALYNFVSPLVALVLGALVYGETLSRVEGVAVACLLGGVMIRYLGRPAGEGASGEGR